MPLLFGLFGRLAATAGGKHATAVSSGDYSRLAKPHRMTRGSALGSLVIVGRFSFRRTSCLLPRRMKCAMPTPHADPWIPPTACNSSKVFVTPHQWCTWCRPCLVWGETHLPNYVFLQPTSTPFVMFLAIGCMVVGWRLWLVWRARDGSGSYNLS